MLPFSLCRAPSSYVGHELLACVRPVFGIVHRALQKVGIEPYSDLNSPKKPALERQARLKICTDTLVTRVELVTEGEDMHATGVEFENTNSRKAWKCYFAKARREVVLCGGALGSPQVLMLRLGPKEHLESKATPVICDLPAVGSYLQDHTLLSANIPPKSIGSVQLASSNPRVRPDVDLGYFNDPEDYVPLRKSIRLAQRIAVEVREQRYLLKDFIVPESSDDEVLSAYIRASLGTCFHYVSAPMWHGDAMGAEAYGVRRRMGRGGVWGAEAYGARPSVVDTQLRVHKMRGLRVCDASVFPKNVGAHMMEPTIMVAEQCGDILRAAK
ncbi:hypothetical protein GSI_12171 [Ganoderma sinense ZZ0214-1]|uniref:Glucose-methanol-choline oxidoreductase N-terminal domain-containing protein n=1 Tax=Ganoderma sinense ZZ0214-1 TaxID=1077348 RepID=A0A2G8RY46_9APHY|nr:hypothetical protein GSI_12171 [Ganoderma sinense ZZ0214-1]